MDSFTNDELMHLHNMVHEIYDSIMTEYTLQKKGIKEMHGKEPRFHGDPMTCKERGFISCGILLKIIKEVHARKLCKDPDCVDIAQKVYDSVFKKEQELDSWLVKRASSYAHQTKATSVRSNSFSVPIQRADTNHQREEGTL